MLPPLPTVADNSTDQSQFDTAIEEPEEDSGIEIPGPPSACEYDEIEPNDEIANPQELPLEEWMCGAFEKSADNDYFTFDIEEESWIHIWVRAEELGSFANPRAFLLDADSSDFSGSLLGGAAISGDDEDQAFTADLDYYIKLDEPRTLNLSLTEQDLLFGPDDYKWRLRVSIVKPPVTWNAEELVDENGDDFNSNKAEAEELVDGMRLFGRLEAKPKRDFFYIDVPDERATVTLETDSWSHGSPLNPCLVLVGTPEGWIPSDDPTTPENENEQVSKCRHDSISNYDAKLQFTSQEAGRYTIKLTDGSSDPGAAGGKPFWYVLETTVDVRPSTDTGLDE